MAVGQGSTAGVAGASTEGVVLASAAQMQAKLRRRAQLKGRQSDEVSLQEVQDLLGSSPAEGYRRDLLIEYLHLINDSQKGLPERHLVALAKLMKIPMAEVYEVASFYHHFEVLRGDQSAPGLTVRVCDGLPCSMAGASDLLARLPALLGDADARVVAVPCIGRCEQAPAALVGQTAIPQASLVELQNAVAQPAPVTTSAQSEVIDYAAYRQVGGYALAVDLAQGRRDPLTVMQALEDSGLRGRGGAGFPAGRKWRIVR